MPSYNESPTAPPPSPDLHLVLVVQRLEEVIQAADLRLDPALQLQVVYFQVPDHRLNDDVLLLETSRVGQVGSS